MGVRMPKEADIQRAIIARLELAGALVVRTNSGAVKVGDRFVRFNSQPGCSDLLVCYRGRFLAVEVKAGKNRPTELQTGFLLAVRRAGGRGEVVRSVADAEAVLVAIDLAAGPGG
jgi:hypothetical protein